MDTFRESAVGQILKYIGKDRWMRYPEEEPDFRWAPLVCLNGSEHKVSETFDTDW